MSNTKLPPELIRRGFIGGSDARIIMGTDEAALIRLRNASKAPLRWSYGLIQEKGQYLYVTSGIGTSGIPLRWRAPPEIVVLDLNGPSQS